LEDFHTLFLLSANQKRPVGLQGIQHVSISPFTIKKDED
jgi:hypothetical protein